MEGAAIFGLSIPCSFHYPSDHPPPLRSFPGRLYLKLCQFPFHTATSNCVAVVHIGISVCKEKNHNLPICKLGAQKMFAEPKSPSDKQPCLFCLPACHCSAGLGVHSRLIWAGWLPGGESRNSSRMRHSPGIFSQTNFCLSTSVGSQGPFGAETSTSQDHRRTMIVMLKDRFLWCTNISTLLTYKVNLEGKRH